MKGLQGGVNMASPKDQILGRKYKKEFGNDMQDLICAGSQPADISVDSKHTKTIYDVSGAMCKTKDDPGNCRGSEIDPGYPNYRTIDPTHMSCSMCSGSGVNNGGACGSCSGSGVGSGSGGCDTNVSCGNCGECFNSTQVNVDEYGYSVNNTGCPSCGCGSEVGGCDSCGTPDTCKDGCGDREKCAINCSTMRSYKKSRVVNTRGDEEVDGIGYKVFDFMTEEDNKAEINMITSSCGDHQIVMDCTKEPIHEYAFKVCTLNEFYFDPENCRYQYMYRYLGIPDPGDPDNPDLPWIEKPGATDTFIKFLHPRYDMRFKIGMYLNDVDMEWVKRDAGRVIHACLGPLLNNKTTDEITYRPTGPNGKMTEIDWYILSQLMTYKDRDYGDDFENYGIVKERPQDTRSKEPPISRYKLQVCPSDVEYICINDTVTSAEFKGWIRYEARPYATNGEWYYKLYLALENGRLFVLDSSSGNVAAGCGGGETCVGDNWRELKVCGKDLSGCKLTIKANEGTYGTGYVGEGCVTIQGYNKSFNHKKEYVLKDENHATFVWAELDIDSCGRKDIKYKDTTIEWQNKTQMMELGDYWNDRIQLIVPICAFQHMSAGSASGKSVSINDYRQYINLNEINYEMQYSNYSANKRLALCAFGEFPQISFDLWFSRNGQGAPDANGAQMRFVGGDDVTSVDEATFHERGVVTGVSASGDATHVNNRTGGKFGYWTGLGWVGSNNESIVGVFGECSFDAYEGIRYHARSSSAAYLDASYNISTTIVPSSQPATVFPYRVEFRQNGDGFFNDFGIKTKGRIRSNRLPIWFMGILEQN